LRSARRPANWPRLTGRLPGSRTCFREPPQKGGFHRSVLPLLDHISPLPDTPVVFGLQLALAQRQHLVCPVTVTLARQMEAVRSEAEVNEAAELAQRGWGLSHAHEPAPLKLVVGGLNYVLYCPARSAYTSSGGRSAIAVPGFALAVRRITLQHITGAGR
jgi:hypothetical protein